MKLHFQNKTIYCLQETRLKYKDAERLKVQG